MSLGLRIFLLQWWRRESRALHNLRSPNNSGQRWASLLTKHRNEHRNVYVNVAIKMLMKFKLRHLSNIYYADVPQRWTHLCKLWDLIFIEWIHLNRNFTVKKVWGLWLWVIVWGYLWWVGSTSWRGNYSYFNN